VEHKCRVLAVDYGEKNIGLACSDDLGITVSPLASIPNLGPRDVLDRLRATVRAKGIERLVLGLPLSMDGTVGRAADRVERLMGNLQAELKLPVSGFDERLSTVEAMEIWQTMNVRQQRRYRSVDSLAAALILERYLRET